MRFHHKWSAQSKQTANAGAYNILHLNDLIVSIILPHDPMGTINFWKLHKHHIGPFIYMFNQTQRSLLGP
jgi:hypothetical protein